MDIIVLDRKHIHDLYGIPTTKSAHPRRKRHNRIHGRHGRGEEIHSHTTLPTHDDHPLSGHSNHSDGNSQTVHGPMSHEEINTRKEDQQRTRRRQSDGRASPDTQTSRPVKRQQQQQQQQHQELRIGADTDTDSARRLDNSPSLEMPARDETSQSDRHATSATQSESIKSEREESSTPAAPREARHFSIESLLTQDAEDEVESLNVSPRPSPRHSISSLPRASNHEERSSEGPEEEVLGSDMQSGSARGRGYTLRLVSVPIQCTADDDGLCDPPLITRLTVHHGAQEVRASAKSGMEEVSGLTCHVALWDAPVTASKEAHRVSFALIGSLVAAPQLLRDAHGEEGIFFVFSDLHITRPGVYHLEVCLQGTWPDGQGMQHQEILRVRSRVSTLAVPEGSPLAVGRVQVDPSTAALLDVLSQQGVSLGDFERTQRFK